MRTKVLQFNNALCERILHIADDIAPIESWNYRGTWYCTTFGSKYHLNEKGFIIADQNKDLGDDIYTNIVMHKQGLSEKFVGPEKIFISVALFFPKKCWRAGWGGDLLTSVKLRFKNFFFGQSLGKTLVKPFFETNICKI